MKLHTHVLRTSTIYYGMALQTTPIGSQLIVAYCSDPPYIIHVFDRYHDVGENAALQLTKQ